MDLTGFIASVSADGRSSSPPLLPQEGLDSSRPFLFLPSASSKWSNSRSARRFPTIYIDPVTGSETSTSSCRNTCAPPPRICRGSSRSTSQRCVETGALDVGHGDPCTGLGQLNRQRPTNAESSAGGDGGKHLRVVPATPCLCALPHRLARRSRQHFSPCRSGAIRPGILRGSLCGSAFTE